MRLVEDEAQDVYGALPCSKIGSRFIKKLRGPHIFAPM